MTSGEVRKLEMILPKLIEYYRSGGNRSVIARIYGVFKVSYPLYAPVHVLLM